MTGNEFLDFLKTQDLLPDHVIDELRKQVDAAKNPITPDAIARTLVRKGRLTTFQARKLLGKARIETEDASKISSSPSPQKAPEPEPESGLLSPLDDLFDDPIMSEEAVASASPLDEMPAKKKRGLFGGKSGKKFKGTGSQWESPLMLLGGGGLVVLLLAGGVLFFVLGRDGGDELFKAAQTDYANGAYMQAMAKYQKMIEKFPNHPSTGVAKVRNVLAQLRNQQKAKDFDAALNSAEKQLPSVVSQLSSNAESKAESDEFRFELSSILPNIADHFAKQAKSAQGPAKQHAAVESYRRALALIQNPAYLPGSLRASVDADVEKMEDTIKDVLRDIDRDTKLDEAIAAIKKESEAGNTKKAYALRGELLTTYPGLRNSTALQTAVRAISVAQKNKVSVATRSLVADTTQPQSEDVKALTIARAGAGNASGVSGHVIFALAEASVYGLAADTGKVLWRRRVGYETSIPPMYADSAVGADAIVVDQSRDAIERLSATDGSLIWRLQVGEPFLPPLVVKDRLFVATHSGKVIDVNLEDGSSNRQAVLPQEISTAPTIDASGNRLLLVSEHSNLYLLGASSLECLNVFYAGHKTGTIHTKPVDVRGIVLAAENHSLQGAKLHIFSPSAEGDPAIQPPIVLKGRVVTDPLVFGSRVLVISDDGSLNVFEIDPNSKDKPVRQIASTHSTLVARGDSTTIGFPWSNNLGDLWVAGRGLGHFQLKTALGRLNQVDTAFDESTFLAPIVAQGNTLFHTRTPNDRRGVLVAAADGKTGATKWETTLAAGSAGEPFFDGKNLICVSRSGDIFSVGRTQLGKTVLDAPIWSPKKRGHAITDRIALPKGRVAFAGVASPQNLIIYDPATTEESVSTLELVAESGTINNIPVVLGDGFLATTEEGPVHLLSQSSGIRLALPFQPPLKPGQKFTWTRPVVVGADQKSFVIFDGKEAIYHVGLSQKDQPHLESLNKAALSAKVVGPLAGLGGTALAVIQGDQVDAVNLWKIPGLVSNGEAKLPGRLAWGPLAFADGFLLAADDGTLVRLSSDGKQKWTYALGGAVPVGQPLLTPEGDTFWLATVDGELIKLAIADGTKLASLQSPQTLGAGPAFLASRLVATAGDGTLYFLLQPTE